VALLSNRSLLSQAGADEPPSTFDGLAATCAGARPGAGIALRGEAHFVKPWLHSFGGGTVDLDLRTNEIARPASVAAVDAYRSLHTSPCSYRGWGFAEEDEETVAAFAEGRVAMVFDGPWSISEIVEGAAFTDPGNLVVSMPAGPAGAVSVLGGHGYAIAEQADHPTAVRRLLAWINSTGAQQRLAAKNYVLPTDAVAHERAIAESTILRAFAFVAAQARAPGLSIEATAVNAELTPRIHRILDERATTAEALLEVANAYQRLFPSFEVNR
jgi:arabinogalactan oligomer / maltooligosaccharide transport system substrate-binding protein